MSFTSFTCTKLRYFIYILMSFIVGLTVEFLYYNLIEPIIYCAFIWQITSAADLELP